MLGKTYDAEVCSIARALEVVGERWSLLILRNAMFAGATRYSDFQRSMAIASNVLKDRLDGFVEAGLMRRHLYSARPELYEYLLTDKARDLEPALVALTAWGDRWAAPDGPPIIYRHAGCGAAVDPVMCCETCGVVPVGSLEAHPGPGMPADRAKRVADRLATQGTGAN